jgi:hypothetical protein
MKKVIDRNQARSWLQSCRMWSKRWRWLVRVKDEARSTSKADEHRAYQHMIVHHEYVVPELPETL